MRYEISKTLNAGVYPRVLLTWPATGSCPIYAVIPSTTVENSLQITPFYAKQSQFYPFFAPKRRFHEKTNPIQTQFKPIQTQLNPKQSQFKPNFEIMPQPRVTNRKKAGYLRTIWSIISSRI
jgi:hypothetical protein